MKIVDNRKEASKAFENGDIILGISGRHYMVCADGQKAVCLEAGHHINNIVDGKYALVTKKENITITFEGAK